MQAVSGAGYPGVPSLDILGNVIPFISGEEEKIEIETRKILGSLVGEAVEMHPMKVSAHTNRVPVVDGHTETVSVALEKGQLNQMLARSNLGSGTAVLAAGSVMIEPGRRGSPEAMSAVLPVSCPYMSSVSAPARNGARKHRSVRGRVTDKKLLSVAPACN